jgi:hypothetical protein
VSIYDVTPESLRTSAANAIKGAAEHDAKADELSGLMRQASEPDARTRETLLRALGATTATDRIYGSGATLTIRGDEIGDIRVEATTSIGTYPLALQAAIAWRSKEAIRLREMAAEMCEEAAEMDAKGRAA